MGLVIGLFKRCERSISNAGLSSTNCNMPGYIYQPWSKGQTQARKLDNAGKNDFERGNLDSFKLAAVNLGELHSVTLHKSGTDEWIVEYVEVDGPFGTDRFAFNHAAVGLRPVTTGKTAMPIPKPIPKPEQTLKKPEFKTKFKGLVVTADKLGAGTDAKVSIWLTDVNGLVVGPLTIREDGDSMERGQKNEIAITLLDQMAELYKVAVLQDGSKLKDDWLLDRIELGLVDLQSEDSIGLDQNSICPV